MLSFEDDLMITRGGLSRWMVRIMLKSGCSLQGRLAKVLVRRAQLSAERMHARVRRELLKSEEQMASALAFSGRME
jgi:preprotein translocase subunit SecA